LTGSTVKANHKSLIPIKSNEIPKEIFGRIVISDNQRLRLISNLAPKGARVGRRDYRSTTHVEEDWKVALASSKQCVAVDQITSGSIEKVYDNFHIPQSSDQSQNQILTGQHHNNLHSGFCRRDFRNFRFRERLSSGSISILILAHFSRRTSSMLMLQPSMSRDSRLGQLSRMVTRPLVVSRLP
ncbi:hypothetical protein EJB05_09650, partial [Eragrostis curvula]